MAIAQINDCTVIIIVARVAVVVEITAIVVIIILVAMIAVVPAADATAAAELIPEAAGTHLGCGGFAVACAERVLPLIRGLVLLLLLQLLLRGRGRGAVFASERDGARRLEQAARAHFLRGL